MATWACSVGRCDERERHRAPSTGADRTGSCSGIESARQPADVVDDLVVGQIAGRGDDQVGRPVPVLVEPGDGVAGHGLDRLLGAEGLEPEAVVGEQRLQQAGVHDVVGGVLVHEDLLEDDLALGVDLGRPEGGRADHVDEQVEPEGQLARRQPGVVAVCSRLVKAFISPPTASTAIAMSRALRSAVPLNSRCSRKCEAPASASDSSRDPTPAQNPIDTERASGTCSVTTRRPEGRVVSSMPGSGPEALGAGRRGRQLAGRHRSWRRVGGGRRRRPAPGRSQRRVALDVRGGHVSDDDRRRHRCDRAHRRSRCRPGRRGRHDRHRRWGPTRGRGRRTRRVTSSSNASSKETYSRSPLDSSAGASLRGARSRGARSSRGRHDRHDRHGRHRTSPRADRWPGAATPCRWGRRRRR